jgi:hypothetical protein
MARSVLDDLYEQYLTPHTGATLEGKSNPFIAPPSAVQTPPLPQAQTTKPLSTTTTPAPQEEEPTVQLAGPSQALSPAASSSALSSASGASIEPIGQSGGQSYTGGPMNLSNYYAMVQKHESGGNPNASSGIASGLYQFTMPTWLGLARTHPELGLTAANITDPGKQNAAMQILTAQNMQFLASNGVDPNPKNTFMTHFLGPNAPPFIKSMEANPNAPAAPLFPKEAAANRPVFYNSDGSPRSLSQVYNLQTRSFAPSWSTQTAQAPRPAALPASPAGGPTVPTSTGPVQTDSKGNAIDPSTGAPTSPVPL